MAPSDWDFTSDSASTSSILQGTSTGYPKPTGGGSYAYAMRSIVAGAAVSVKYHTKTGFNPSDPDKGGHIQAAIRRGTNNDGYAPFIAMMMQDTANTGEAYILGLADGNPSHIVLRKGDLATGLPDVAVGLQGVLAKSSATYAMQVYYHLKLECVVNGNGDVVLNCYINLGSVASPTWVAIDGLSRVIDDDAGVNTGSVPFTSGYYGWGMRSDQINRVAYFDAVQAGVQN